MGFGLRCNASYDLRSHTVPRYYPVRTSISVVNGATMMAEGEGDVTLNLEVNGTKNEVILKKVLYVPEMGSSGLCQFVAYRLPEV